MTTKNLSFIKRLSFAASGLFFAFRSEKSFRTQVVLGLGTWAVVWALGAEPIWWVAIALTSAGVWATELMNTALEHALDRIHPEQHPEIGRAKDLAAGAVLVMSLVSILVFGLFLLQRFHFY